MSSKVVVVLLGVFMLVQLAAGQTGIKGIYIFSETGRKPVQDITVYTANYSFAEVPDENGFVNFKRWHAGADTFYVSGIGYEQQVLRFSQLKPTNGIATIMMKAKIISLADVMVSASSHSNVFKTIGAFDIRLRPITNSQEVLRMVPGLFIGQHAGGGKAEQIFLRGFDLDHGTDINITADGLPVNMVSHAHGQGYADLHFVIPEMIEKVNFNKGPYYTDKGNLATAGSVEFKTQNFLKKNFVKAEAGQYNTYRTVLGMNLLKPGTVDKNRSLIFAGEASFTNGYFDNPQHFYRLNGLLKYNGKIGKNSYMTAALSAFTSKWDASGQIPDRAVADGSISFYGAIDSTEGGNTSRYNASLELIHNLQNGATWRNQFYLTRYAFELYSNFTFYKDDPINGDQVRQKEKRWITGYNGSYKQDIYLGSLRTEVTAGMQLRYDAIDNSELSRTKNRNINTAQLTLGDIYECNGGVYAQQKYFVNKDFDVTAGIRADAFLNRYDDLLQAGKQSSSSSAIVSPKLQFNYRLSKNTQLYWYSGKGFHSNDTRVAVQENGKDVVTPAWGTDIGGIFKLGNKLVIQTAFWYMWMKQEFVYVGDEAIVEPGGQTQRLGWDMSLRYEMVNNLFADVDLNIANPRALNVPKTESYLPLAPRFSSAGGFTYRRLEGLSGSLRYRWMAERPANEDNTVIAAGYFIADATLGYNRHNWEAGLSVQNIFNSNWKETQFDTESRLKNEPAPVSEIHFTAGTPFFSKLSFTFFF